MTELEAEIVLKAYTDDNFQCVDTGLKSDICYIFFSSNGLYYPDNKEVFEKEIIQKNRYEWKWVVNHSNIPQKAGRIIYVRDVFKDWYSRGINTRIENIDGTLELLKNLTEGYRIVTVGSSAGGYMAVLTAACLKADWCINFSGQYKVLTDVKQDYRDLAGMLRNYDGKIFYFVPINSEQDLEQYRYVQEINCIKEICFSGRKHADTMLTGNMPYIIDRDEEELLQLCQYYKGKIIGKISFLLHTVPVNSIIGILGKEMKGFFRRKIGRHDNGI